MQTLVAQLSWVLAAAMAVGLAHRGLPPPGPKAIPSAHHIQGVPFAERREDWCGPAAMAAVLQFHGEKTTAAQIAKEIYLPGYRGTLNLDLLLWARKQGLEGLGEQRRGVRRRRRRRIAGAGCKLRRSRSGGGPDPAGGRARDRPVICMVRRHGGIADRNHFVIVRGYDNSRRIWFLDEGQGKEQTEGMEGFARDWQECGEWMLVVEGRKPAPGASDGHAGD